MKFYTKMKWLRWLMTLQLLFMVNWKTSEGSISLDDSCNEKCKKELVKTEYCIKYCLAPVDNDADTNNENNEKKVKKVPWSPLPYVSTTRTYKPSTANIRTQPLSTATPSTTIKPMVTMSTSRTTSKITSQPRSTTTTISIIKTKKTLAMKPTEVIRKSPAKSSTIGTKSKCDTGLEKILREGVINNNNNNRELKSIVDVNAENKKIFFQLFGGVLGSCLVILFIVILWKYLKQNKRVSFSKETNAINPTNIIV